MRTACLVNGVLCWGGNKAYPLQSGQWFIVPEEVEE